jgi:hypothetical protein
VDPATQTATTFGYATGKGSKWNHGVAGKDGKIYGIPFDASSILVIDPKTRSVSTLGDFGNMRYKWRVGLVGPDGKIYGIPLNHDSVLVIDTESGLFDMIPCGDIGRERMKWNGAAIGPDGRIYCIPANSQSVLIIDPCKRTTTLLGDLGRGSAKWRNGVLGPDGNIYGMPFDDRSVLVINTCNQSVSRLGDVGAEKGKWADGTLGDDGKIYGIPQLASSVLVVDPWSRSLSLLGKTEEVDDPVAEGVESRMCGKWIECFKADNGNIYGVPVHASSILVISPTAKRNKTLGDKPHSPQNLDCQGRWSQPGPSMCTRTDVAAGLGEGYVHEYVEINAAKRRWTRKQATTSPRTGKGSGKVGGSGKGKSER